MISFRLMSVNHCNIVIYSSIWFLQKVVLRFIWFFSHKRMSEKCQEVSYIWKPICKEKLLSKALCLLVKTHTQNYR